MKLKYKKALLLILLSTMGTGILTLSFSSKNGNKEETSTETMSLDSDKATDPDAIDLSAVTPTIAPSFTPTPYPTQTPVPTQIPTPTPLPAFSFEDGGYPKIEALIEDYYDAKVNCNVDKFKGILDNPADVPSLEQLQTDVTYIEKYQAIKCYIKKSYEEGSYIVYAYYEIKFLNIDTLAPAVDGFYIITDSAGDLKVFSGKLDETHQKYYYDRLQDEDVQKLIQETNAKSDEAKASDKLLKTFWDALKAAQEAAASENTTSPEDSSNQEDSTGN